MHRGFNPLDEADLQEHLTRYQPRLILARRKSAVAVATIDTSSLWRRAMREFGYGLTTVLQAVLAFRIGRAAQQCAPNAAFVNCCYPDAVNPLLLLAGIPVTCGTGNVSIIGAVWQSRRPTRLPVRILAHHAH